MCILIPTVSVNGEHPNIILFSVVTQKKVYLSNEMSSNTRQTQTVTASFFRKLGIPQSTLLRFTRAASISNGTAFDSIVETDVSVSTTDSLSILVLFVELKRKNIFFAGVGFWYPHHNYLNSRKTYHGIAFPVDVDDDMHIMRSPFVAELFRSYSPLRRELPCGALILAKALLASQTQQRKAPLLP